MPLLYLVNASAIDENNAQSEITGVEVTIVEEVAETSILNFAMIILIAIIIAGLLFVFLEYLRRKKGLDKAN